MNLQQELFVVNGEGEVLEGYDIVSPEAKKTKNVYSNFGNISKDIFTIVFLRVINVFQTCCHKRQPD